MDDNEGKQWAILLIKNVILTADTRNSINFRLKVNAAVRSQVAYPTMVKFRKQDAEELINSIEAVNAMDNMDNIASTLNELTHTINLVKMRIHITHENDGARITLEDAPAAIRKAKMAPEIEERKPVGRIVRKGVFKGNPYADIKRSKMQDMNTRTHFMACGEKDHWFRDSENFMKIMDQKEKMERDINHNTGHTNSSMNSEHTPIEIKELEDTPVPAFFRRPVQ